jgi:glycosyltransferase involved in cell wall biosynthesis
VRAVPAGEPLLLCVGGPLEAVPAYREIGRATALPPERLAFHDRVPNRDVPAWIRACDVVTIPSPRTEFFSYCTSPMKLFEYMAAGAPIVATDLPAIREVLRHGDNALLAAPGNPAAFADALHVLLDDRACAARLAARARADVERFTWQHRAAALLAACEAPHATETH